MSRNPILTDQAFGIPGATGRGASPAEEWETAKRSGAGSAATGSAAAQQAAWDRTTPTPPVVTDGRTMSLGGVASATLVMFAFVLLGGWWGWSQVVETRVLLPGPGEPVVTAEMKSPGLLIGALLIGLALALVTAFRPKAARFTAVPYALAEGVVLGMISHLYNARFEGIVAQAIVATFGVFLAMLALYGLRVLRATPRFVKGVIAATFGVLVLYLGSFVFSLFTGETASFMHDSSALGIGISLVVVAIAALNLILDFDFIERGSQNQLPAYMDWYGAFGLVVTLVWLYLEMLRLLARLRE